MKAKIVLLWLLLPLIGLGNGIQLTNLSTNYQASSGTCKVIFDLSWENSWRSAAISNHDAAWIFFKFKESGIWKHLDVTGLDISLPSGFAYHVPTDKKGIFIFRDAPGVGNISLTGVEIGVQPKMGTFDLKAFALEMVKIPSGAFFIGDGSSNFCFKTGNSSNPFYVYTAAVGITMGNTNLTELNDPIENGVLDEGFPTGVADLFCMKYELSQGAYRDFLNTLSYRQQENLLKILPNSNAGTSALIVPGAPSLGRNTIKVQTSGVAPLTPAVFGCDGNSNSIFNESGDGEWIPVCNLNWPMIAAYLDWAALRPMTEMEYEKICRGNETPISGEHAWGSHFIDTVPFTFTNLGLPNEGVIQVSPLGAANFGERHSSGSKPLRGGLFAGSTTTRTSSGATFYGVMEMTGNMLELVVGTSSAAGRSFSGLHGNGQLNLDGFADVNFWPGINGNTTYSSANQPYSGTDGVTGAAGISARGGSFMSVRSVLGVSNRLGFSQAGTVVSEQYGIRGVRSF
ncbi:MAG: hypothetical protein LCH37_09345 [Bacteroidetes bacterium]|nr:hypothetical protein [Bacteroidota bacterium]